MLEVKLAKTAGFCWGVKRAMDIVMDVSEKVKGTLYTYGPLIHNPQVIEMLESKNIIVLKDFKNADSDNLVIRTHGVTPAKRREIKKKGFNINDATCPLVMKVQSIIKRHARKGHSTIIVGDKDHAEVEGLLGFTEGRGSVIENESEVEGLPPIEKVCVVAQTTFDKILYENITKGILKRFPNALIFKTTCDTTDQRQTEVINLAKTVDAMIVVGGKNSANTARLAQISKASGVPTFFIETEKEIDERQLNGFQTVGVTAGASTPTWMISRVMEKVESIKKRELSRVSQFSLFLGKFLIFSNLYVAIGGGVLTYSICQLQHLTPKFSYAFVAFSYFLSMYMLNNFTDREALEHNNPTKNIFYEKYKFSFLTLGILSSLVALAVSFELGTLPFTAVFASTLLGIFYSVKIIPRDIGFNRYWRLKDIPASKDIFIALAWATITVLVPFLSQESIGSFSATSVAFLFVFSLVYARSLLFDIRDIQGDQLIGRETIPIIIGKEKTKLYLGVVLIMTAVGLSISGWLSWTSSLSFFLLASIGYCVFYLYLYHKRIISQGVSCDAVVDGQFYVTGLITLAWMNSFAA
tara:strand:- start:22705 stop:24447 length:1743 start_codon:yes stop_codon:yes gene_type:complete